MNERYFLWIYSAIGDSTQMVVIKNQYRAIYLSMEGGVNACVFRFVCLLVDHGIFLKPEMQGMITTPNLLGDLFGIVEKIGIHAISCMCIDIITIRLLNFSINFISSVFIGIICTNCSVRWAGTVTIFFNFNN